MARFSTQSTPNPNSLKITRRNGTFIESGVLSFDSPESASKHPLAARLFELDGVANVLILPEFLTVTRHPSADWTSLWRDVEKTLKAHFA